MIPKRRGIIRVLAGTNGAGKSSIGGEMLRAAGADYFDPDEVARALLASGAVSTQVEANSLAWKRGRDLLERAIAENADYTFETTLGARTIPRLLEAAADAGLEVHIWYVALESADLHVQRVKERVARGGHDIPPEKIQQRYDDSRANLVRLLPKLTSLRVFDNSAPPDPDTGEVAPMLVLQMENGQILYRAPDGATPAWARPVIAAAASLST